MKASIRHYVFFTPTAVLMSISIFGCRGSGLTARPGAGSTTPGLRYYLGRDVIVVDGTMVQTVGKRIDSDLKLQSFAWFKTADATVAVQTVPDVSQSFIIDIQPAALKDQSLAVQVSDDGLLTSINLTSTDKTGEIITNISKFAAGVARAYFGFKDGPPDDAAWQAIFDLTAEGKQLAAKPAEYDVALKQFRDTTATTAYFLGQSGQALALWNSRVRFEHQLSDRTVFRNKLLEDISKKADKAGIDLGNSQLASINDEITELTKQRDAVVTAFQSALDAFKADRKIAETDYTTKIHYTFELTDLPNSTDVDSNVDNALTGKSAMRAMFDQNKVLLAIHKATSAQQDVFPAVAPPLVKAEGKHPYYREATPVTLDVYAMVRDPDKNGELKDKLRRVDQKLVSVLHPFAETRQFIYDPGLFSTQGIQLAFNKQGRLTGLNQSTAATADAATTALANSLSSAQSAFLGAVTNVQSIEDARHKIEQANLQEKVDTLTKEKAIVDGQIALQGETASQKLIAQQSLLTNQLNLLTAQQALGKAQATNPLSLEQAKTQADVDLIKVQIQVLQQQLNLQNAQNGKFPSN